METKAEVFPSYEGLKQWLKTALERSLLPAYLEEFLVECGVTTMPSVDFYVHTWDNLVLEEFPYIHPIPSIGDNIRLSKGNFLESGEVVVEGTVLKVVHDIWTEGKCSRISVLIEPSRVSSEGD